MRGGTKYFFMTPDYLSPVIQIIVYILLGELEATLAMTFGRPLFDGWCSVMNTICVQSFSRHSTCYWELQFFLYFNCIGEGVRLHHLPDLSSLDFRLSFIEQQNEGDRSGCSPPPTSLSTCKLQTGRYPAPWKFH